MIRPVSFGFNEETAQSNAFQVRNDEQNETVQQKAQIEFDGFVEVLRANGVDVTVVNDTQNPHTPDSIFPNNWVSFHNDGTVILYPMQAVNRRLERRTDILDQLNTHFDLKKTIDFSHFETESRFLEGTGSMVLDRDNKIAYACLSPRTDDKILNEFCKAAGYKKVAFISVDDQGKQIYHTNVMMCIGDKFAVVCFDSIPDPEEKENVLASLVNSGKEVIEISFEQMNKFAGNMLQVLGKNGESLLIMSEQAYKSLMQEQIAKLEQFSKLVYAPIYTIETNGGGSARCMMAEIHLPFKN
ncbi:citrulline utilization hydrolase CtlX [Solitalea koreensis]|nr:arginine deiminase-related protein [Solitalea koreensis]